MARSIVMLDMDGTLVDTMPQLIETFVTLLKDELGEDEAVARQQILDRMHLPPRQLIPELSALVGWDAADFNRVVAELVLKLPPTPFPEVPAALAALKSAGYTLVLSSTTPQDAIEARLTAAAIASHFDLALGTNAPAGLTKEDHPGLAAERLGVSPEAFKSMAIFVGDTIGDMAMAKAAGVVAVGRLSGENGTELAQAGADHLIRDLTEVEPLLAQLA